MVEAIRSALQPPEIPRYTNRRDLAEYLDTFQKVAEKHQWDDSTAGIKLQNALEGKPQDLATSVATTSFTEISRVLRERLVPRPEDARRALTNLRLTGEEVEELGTRVRRLANLGFGPQGYNLNSAGLEKEKIYAYLGALHPDEVAHQGNVRCPGTLDEAIQYARDYFTLQSWLRHSRQVILIMTPRRTNSVNSCNN
jgi:hypothetical protein